MGINKLFANLSWYLLIVILYSRPLRDILRWKILDYLVAKRKILGIICGAAAFLHVEIYLIASGNLGGFFTNANFWRLDNFFGWGSLALVAMALPLLTSNIFSQRLLKRHWKTVQRFTYLAFIFVGLHITLLHQGDWTSGLLPVGIWALLWLGAWKKRKKD